MYQAVDVLAVAVGFVLVQLLAVLRYPIDPAQRIFLLFILSSLVLAILVYARRRGTGPTASLREFLFPRHVWSDSSAWLDVRYFFFHQIFRLVIYGSFLLGTLTLFSGWAEGLAAAMSAGGGAVTLGPLATAALVLLATVVVDFLSFLTHYLQHKLPVLWEFHKVHHSATVMHPLTNYREHPVDNILYAITFGLAIAIVSGSVTLLIGRAPDPAVLASGGIVVLAYNLLGYNLRHSHIWLRWPGILSRVLGSPAHHQVHHSCHPDHIDRNFAFMFPLWDVLFGTYEMPEDDRDVRFGLGSAEEREFRSCLGLYFLPFRKVLERLRPPQKPAAAQRTSR